MGILDHETAMNYINVPVMAVNIYPSLPTGTNPDYMQYQYLKIKFPNGENGCIALEWIDKTTYVIHEGVNITFRVENANMSDVDKIRQILSFNGYESVNFTTL